MNEPVSPRHPPLPGMLVPLGLGGGGFSHQLPVTPMPGFVAPTPEMEPRSGGDSAWGSGGGRVPT